MLMQRIMGAFMFRKEVYADVEKDTAFTSTAWLLVVVVAFLSQLGGSATLAQGRFIDWPLATIGGTIGAVIGFGVAAFVIAWVGHALFQADVTFQEMVRTLGLAYIWNVVGVLGIVGALGSALSCLVAPVVVIGALAGLVAWFVAAKEALDLEWGQTIITVIIGWVVLIVISILTGIVLGILGIGAAGLAGLFGM